MRPLSSPPSHPGSPVCDSSTCERREEADEEPSSSQEMWLSADGHMTNRGVNEVEQSSHMDMRSSRS